MAIGETFISPLQLVLKQCSQTLQSVCFFLLSSCSTVYKKAFFLGPQAEKLCRCGVRAGLFSKRLGFSWKNYSMNRIVEMSLDEPRLCPVVGLCSLLMSECDSKGRRRGGCKSGAVVWNAARVRTRFLFQLCKTPLKSMAC